MGYIRQPTALVYGVVDISAQSSKEGHCFATKTKWEANVVDIGFALDMLNFSKT
ncbi:hypothetical protein LguiA_029916 [Lonicera macranthoides]